MNDRVQGRLNGKAVSDASLSEMEPPAAEEPDTRTSEGHPALPHDVRPFVELRELDPGASFMFHAEDLEERGPCELVSKSVGSAVIRYAPREVTETFDARNPKTGEVETRTITRHVSGERPCALGAQVVPIVDVAVEMEIARQEEAEA